MAVFVQKCTLLEESSLQSLCTLCEYCQRQSCTVFTGLSNRTKIVGGDWGHPLLPPILAKIDYPLQKRQFPIDIVAP